MFTQLSSTLRSASLHAIGSPQTPLPRSLAPLPMRKVRRVTNHLNHNHTRDLKSFPQGRACTRRRAIYSDNRAYAQPSVGEYASARHVLTRAIQEAVKREDYKVAAALKRELEHHNDSDPAHEIMKQLDNAIATEKYEDASRLQARLMELEGMPEDDLSKSMSCSSVTVTNGIRVTIQSFYRPDESAPAYDEFLFGYRVQISNESRSIVQLKQRHWVVTDRQGEVTTIRGPGVMSQQPILGPGKSFEYTSSSRIQTPIGSMEGEFTLLLHDEETGEWDSEFFAHVLPFKLSVMDE